MTTYEEATLGHGGRTMTIDRLDDVIRWLEIHVTWSTCHGGEQAEKALAVLRRANKLIESVQDAVQAHDNDRRAYSALEPST